MVWLRPVPCSVWPVLRLSFEHLVFPVVSFEHVVVPVVVFPLLFELVVVVLVELSRGRLEQSCRVLDDLHRVPVDNVVCGVGLDRDHDIVMMMIVVLQVWKTSSKN